MNVAITTFIPLFLGLFSLVPYRQKYQGLAHELYGEFLPPAASIKKTVKVTVLTLEVGAISFERYGEVIFRKFS